MPKVLGYVDQPEGHIDMVNENKLVEEACLQMIDYLELLDSVDKRWLAIGRTHIELGWMAINRAIFRPERVQE
jgi:hypothetical protein